MSTLQRLGLAALHLFEPERAHGLALRALKAGLVPARGPVTAPRLATEIAGLALPNPLGLAAGFDKNAEALDRLAGVGFGFLEAGAVTPRPQAGNPRPRLFRLPEDAAAINRFGFNNDGMEVIAGRLAAYGGAVPLGLNIGPNKDSANRVADYIAVMDRCAAHVDFITLNVSSPNTGKLRDLAGAAALNRLLGEVMEANADRPRPARVFLKIAPDLGEADLDAIVDAARAAGVAAIIATNTTLARDGLRSAQRTETGGLSGQPLFVPSTRVLAQLRLRVGGDIPLIGVGGIASAEQAYAKIRAGASALQIYTGLIYAGPPLVRDVLAGLERLLARDGYPRLADAVGCDPESWL